MFKLLTKNQINTVKMKIGIFGITYKENINDTRNSLALKLIKDLIPYHVDYCVHDPFDHSHHALKVPLHSFEEMNNLTVVIIVIGHDYYKKIGLEKILSQCQKPAIIMDIPGLFQNKASTVPDLVYWKL
jgi:UDP-N-acetyl-D-galactosamine dehydrogenase